eukprot:TRINITY_DN9741_c0_g1_i1.p1 TRINITY_DN9741_c0_g1~~TRINITY_DN9741_c0_g1_i1.p1  ORF type:complete len:426 (-),score=89.37 TRINITY_DN9741_c0_g1_i1:66-1343(-)
MSLFTVLSWTFGLMFAAWILGKVGRWLKDFSMRRSLVKRASAYTPSGESKWKGKRFLVFVNPFSGWRRGQFLHDKIVAPMLQKAGIETTVITTEFSGHAEAVLSDTTFDISNFCGVICISGDGLTHEIYNGLFARLRSGQTRKMTPDEEDEAFGKLLDSFPLALVTAGSSNGLAMSLGIVDAFEATKRIIEGDKRKIDLLKVISRPKIGVGLDAASISSTSEKLIWDCCVLSYAIVSEHDEWQEHRLRFLPTEIRNVLAPLIVIAQNKVHRARVDLVPTPITQQEMKVGWYKDTKPLDNAQPNSLLQSPAGDKTVKTAEADFTLLAITNIPWAATDCFLGPDLKLDEGSFDLLILKNASRLELLSMFIGLADGSYLKSDKTEHYKVTEVMINPYNEDGRMFMSGERIPYGCLHLMSKKQLGTVIV